MIVSIRYLVASRTSRLCISAESEPKAVKACKKFDDQEENPKNSTSEDRGLWNFSA
jgi:hypothetical protein